VQIKIICPLLHYVLYKMNGNTDRSPRALCSQQMYVNLLKVESASYCHSVYFTGGCNYKNKRTKEAV